MRSGTIDAIATEMGASLPRRRLGIAAAGLAALLGLHRSTAVDARKRRRRKCRKNEKRCGRKCVKGTCCPGKPCGSAGSPVCKCTKATDGRTFCENLDIASLCLQCPAAGCGPSSRCIPVSCGMNVTAACVAVCPT
jgi:hypothetical protein